MKYKFLALAGVACLMTAAFGLAACKPDEPEKPEPSEATVVSIEVDASDAKTEYLMDEEFDESGLKITATYSDDTTKSIDPEDCTYSGFDSSMMALAGPVEITVTYEGKSDTYEITVTAPEDPPMEVPEGWLVIAAPDPASTTYQMGYLVFDEDGNWEFNYDNMLSMAGTVSGEWKVTDGVLSMTGNFFAFGEITATADGGITFTATNTLLDTYIPDLGTAVFTLSAEECAQLGVDPAKVGGTVTPPDEGGEEQPGGDEPAPVDGVTLTIEHPIAGGSTLTLTNDGKWVLQYAGWLAMGGPIAPIEGTFTYENDTLTFEKSATSNLTITAEAGADGGMTIVIDDPEQAAGGAAVGLGHYELTITAEQLAQLQ